jgi:hypothetical protein
MNDEQYEDLYSEALLCLGQIVEVGEPFLQPDRTRVCKVGEQLLNDQQVLERWWGEIIAARIKPSGVGAHSPLLVHS